MFGFMRRNGIMVTIDLAHEIPEDRKCIVVDGESLMWMLYVWSAHWGVGLTCSWVHGGETLHWYHLLKNFFELFLRQGIREWAAGALRSCCALLSSVLPGLTEGYHALQA